MKISVITVVHNAVMTIERTLLSILEQDYQNIEYIIIDGGSTDGTVDLIRKHEKKISYWISEPDDGIYHAMNKGVEHASGELIGFISGNDWYDQGAIRKIADEYAVTGSDVIYGDVAVFDGDGFRTKEYSQVDLDEFHYIMPIIHPGMFVKADILKRYRFDQTYRSAADAKLLMQIYRDGYSFSYTHNNIAFYGLDGISSDPNVGPVETLRAAKEAWDDDFFRYKDKAYLFYYYGIFKGLLKERDFITWYCQYSKELLGESTYIYGAGAKCCDVIIYLNMAGIMIAGIIDSDFNKQGTIYQEWIIQSPDFLLSQDSNSSILVSSTRYDMEIKGQIERNNKLRNYHVTTLLEFVKDVVTGYFEATDRTEMILDEDG